MPALCVIVGRKVYPELHVPEACTVGEWKELLGDRVHGARRLIIFVDERVLSEQDTLPQAPKEVVVTGPTGVLGSLGIALAGGSANHPSPAKPFKSQRVPQRRFFKSGLIGRSPATQAANDDTTSTKDRASAEAILEFWFQDLSPEDWFRLSHLIDDRIWREFGPLHRRAAAGELAGWKAGPETCLALVVMLDQFSRRLYRGTAAAYTCDGLAREAASAALIRGDDHYCWPIGPRRCALYLPFIHIDDIADKTKLFAALGAQDSTTDGGKKELQRLLGVAANAIPTGPRDSEPEEDGSLSALEEKVPLPSLESPLGAVALPQLRSAPRLDSRSRWPSEGEGQGQDPSEESSVGHSDEDSDEGDFLDHRGSESPRMARAPSRARSNRGTNVGLLQPAVGKGQALGREFSGGFAPAPSQPGSSRPRDSADPELPKIQALTLNHEFGRRFRTMMLDKKTQQAYDRDNKQALSVNTRYECLVCSERHDFRVQGQGQGRNHKH